MLLTSSSTLEFSFGHTAGVAEVNVGITAGLNNLAGNGVEVSVGKAVSDGTVV